MAKKQIGFKTKGMNKDLSVSAFNPEFAFENMNLRLSTNEGNTLLSWVNEKGTSNITLVKTDDNGNQLKWDDNRDATITELRGIAIGTAVLNHCLVVFAADTGGPDCYIYALKYADTTKNKMMGILLYDGELHFSIDHPLETRVSYEAENIQKVYWTDGVNQPRVINIKGTYSNKKPFIFDFIPELQLQETITVLKKLGSNGMFAPGVIQYAFTYYNKYCQETNIFYTTPLYYISHADRGASPEDKVDNAFQITVDGVDTNFEYLRIYSIQRTSINGTPLVKRIQDIEIAGLDEYPANSGKYRASYLDAGTSGDSVDPTELLYKGGNAIIATTLEQKDDTLFLGNIKTLINRALGPTEKTVEGSTISITSGKFRNITPLEVSVKDYIYSSQLSALNDDGFSIPCAGFKYGDTYRCGVQFQHKTGKWSDPTYIGNYPIPNSPQIVPESKKIQIPVLKGTIPSEVCNKLIALGYVRARAVVVYPNLQDRATICQGVACPTLFTDTQRNTDKSVYAQSSWFFRTIDKGKIDSGNGTVSPSYTLVTTETTSGSTTDKFLEYTSVYMKADGIYNPGSKPTTGTNSENPDNSSGNTGDTTGTNPQGESTIDYEVDDYGMLPDEGGSGSGSAEDYNPKNHIRKVEIQGQFNKANKFQVDFNTLTFHSPEVEFDAQLASMDYSSCLCRQIGLASFDKTFSDISIQTETPVSSNDGAGFIHKSFTADGMYGIVSGLFYDDYLINDDNGRGDNMLIGPYDGARSSCKWMVYLWNKTGSLNNDINRPATQGIATAKLKKKVVSNLRIANSNYNGNTSIELAAQPQLFSSDDPTIVKLNVEGDSKVYMGNVDTILNPDDSEGMYFVFNNTDLGVPGVRNPFISSAERWWKTYYDAKEKDKPSQQGTVWYRDLEGKAAEKLDTCWIKLSSDFFGKYRECAVKKDFVRMKYKSTPHLVFTAKSNSVNWSSSGSNPALPIVEVRKEIDSNTIFGGESMDALKENIWIPCGEPKPLNASDGTIFEYSYGDTYYQRYDCLKTYAYTKEDENQVVEIGSFMLETRVNIDGRYDRNRGQLSNLNMSPQNFNLINPVYSQINNFFTYRIMDDSYYENTQFPNQITWSKTKTAGADVDLWTNVTLASVLELDGDKGKLNKLIRLNDQLLAFQDTGISQILYNDNVQISSTDGVPIEIANSGKVQGKRYLSNTIGCSNKWSMATTPNGIYFMDSHDKGIYLFNGQLNNISNTGGFNTWCKKNIPLTKDGWKPDFSAREFVAYYDKLNQDVLFINKDKALAWSEKLQAFTSFYDYGGIPFFCNLDDTGIWIKNGESGAELWKHQGSNSYCQFFGENKPYWMTLVGNPEPQTDKIFTNLEFRACVDGDGTSKVVDEETVMDKFYLPFDYLETWNEYQHGYTALDNKTGHSMFIHGGDSSALIRKFRIWRNDIPRNNCLLDDEHTAYDIEHPDAKLPYKFDSAINISRHVRKPVDRMRNPWLYLTLMKNAAEEGKSLPKAEIHDLIMTYFN